LVDSLFNIKRRRPSKLRGVLKSADYRAKISPSGNIICRNIGFNLREDFFWSDRKSYVDPLDNIKWFK
jgi:hypothetical protein